MPNPDCSTTGPNGSNSSGGSTLLNNQGILAKQVLMVLIALIIIMFAFMREYISIEDVHLKCYIVHFIKSEKAEDIISYAYVCVNSVIRFI